MIDRRQLNISITVVVDCHISSNDVGRIIGSDWSKDLQKVLEVKVKTFFFFFSLSLIDHHIDPQFCVTNYAP